MPPTQTLALDINYPVIREQLAPRIVSQVGAGAISVRRLYERPAYRFRIRALNITKASAEAFYSFAAWHQGDTPFWFGGADWGNVANPLLVGFGTGTQTQWFLPNRNILSGPTVTVNGVPTGVTLTSSSGLITFTSPPANNAEIRAHTYTCRYKCVFWPEGDLLLSEENFYHQLFSYEGVVLREIIP